MGAVRRHHQDGAPGTFVYALTSLRYLLPAGDDIRKLGAPTHLLECLVHEMVADAMAGQLGEQLAYFHHRGRFAVLEDLVYDQVNPFVYIIVNHVSKFVLWILVNNASRESHDAPYSKPANSRRNRDARG
jgi:hypothetical protein